MANLKKTQCDLPQEILLKIFALCKAEQGLSSLCNLLNVSRLWRRIALDHSLWEEVDDIHLSPVLLRDLAILGAFSKTRAFNLRSLGGPHDDRYMFSILQHCPEMKLVRLSNKICIPDYLKILPLFCPEIEGITFYQPFCLSASELNELLEKIGQKLTKFGLLDVDLDSPEFATIAIAQHCPNLRELSFTCSSREDCIPIHALETGCPHLVKLKLTINGFTDSQESTASFSQLEEFDFSSFKRYSLDIPEIARVLRSATKLKVLNLFDCNISCAMFLSLPILNLKILKLSYCSIDPPNELSNVLNKWKDSLTMLSIICLYVEDGDLVDHVRTFAAAGGKNHLEVLKLGSELSSQKIFRLVRDSPKLRYLKLLDIRLCSREEIERWLLFYS